MVLQSERSGPESIQSEKTIDDRLLWRIVYFQFEDRTVLRVSEWYFTLPFDHNFFGIDGASEQIHESRKKE